MLGSRLVLRTGYRSSSLSRLLFGSNLSLSLSTDSGLGLRRKVRTMSSSTVNIQGVDVELCTGLTREDLDNFPAFQTWLPRLQSSLALQSKPTHPHHQKPYTLRKITTNSYTRFGTSLGFLSLTALLKNALSETLPGSILLRGPSVAILLLISPTTPSYPSEKYVILTNQARVAAGSMEFLELPAGMVDGEREFKGTAAREIEEECGLVVKEGELVDLTALALEGKEGEDSEEGEGKEENLPMGMWPSAGGCDEYLTLYACEKKMERAKLDELRGKLTGLRAEGEKITLKLVKFEDLWREGARDAKALGALALYQNLKMNGKL